MTAFILTLSLLGIVPGQPIIPPCATEDATACYWDAETQGNGEGLSFLADADGNVTYLTEED